MKTYPLIAVIFNLALAVALSSCTAEDNSPGGGVDLTNRFLVANLPRSTNTMGGTTFVPDNYRTFFVTFSIGTSTAEEGEYRLGIKQASKRTPTVTELTNTSAAITRTLSSNQINIYLPFHIEGTYFDTGAAQDYATARATVLSPATSYTLYITPADGSGTVENLLDFTTDAVPATVPNTAEGASLFYGLPSAQYRYTVRINEPFMLISEFGSYDDIARYFGNDQKLTDCGSTGCDILYSSSYTVLTSNPYKTFILEGLKDQWDNLSFDNGSPTVGKLQVNIIFQTAP